MSSTATGPSPLQQLFADVAGFVQHLDLDTDGAALLPWLRTRLQATQRAFPVPAPLPPQLSRCGFVVRNQTLCNQDLHVALHFMIARAQQQNFEIFGTLAKLTALDPRWPPICLPRSVAERRAALQHVSSVFSDAEVQQAAVAREAELAALFSHTVPDRLRAARWDQSCRPPIGALQPSHAWLVSGPRPLMLKIFCLTPRARPRRRSTGGLRLRPKPSPGSGAGWASPPHCQKVVMGAGSAQTQRAALSSNAALQAAHRPSAGRPQAQRAALQTAHPPPPPPWPAKIILWIRSWPSWAPRGGSRLRTAVGCCGPLWTAD
eukprot:gnl/Hemi2/24926_TR8386_c0_g1_i1.p1 gnl/Hemi2/24926_TR8386_c0_g1~~gnl/Hemi2/24926_TR8386_c0_g1_i1.p1  ORF type:complete len:319 (-),score=30.08 gnl/Hemi2/24926_TR8386_c0_g1_i1:263-1219(-)